MPTLHWLTRDKDLAASSQAPYRLLNAVETYGKEPNAQNILIQGDNLDALKALLPFYAGKIDCVYIDPPFNTEQAMEHYDDNVRHSLWLSILYPKLEILRELLSESGSIFVHIDDNELAYLTVIMDEIFGRSNRISLVTFKQGAATGHKSINPKLVTTTNFITIYAKNSEKWKFHRLFTSRNRDKRYGQYIVNINDEFKYWRTITLSKAFSNYHGKAIKELKNEFSDQFEDKLNSFVIQNAECVIRTARPDYAKVSADARKMIDDSKSAPEELFLLERDNYPDMYIKNGERWLFYKNKLKEVDGKLVSGEPLTTLWDDILSNNLHNEGGVKFPKGKKPENLIKRIFELVTDPGDLVLDSFLGSGTTVAVAHKMNRKYIGVERGDHAVTHCIPRLQKVIEGEQGGISKAINWKGGGGFRFYRLGETIFSDDGKINPSIRFPALAAHIWFCEAKTPYAGEANSPLLGIHNGIAYYLLFNGILGDKTVNGGNVLTTPILKSLPPYDGPKVIYGEGCRFGAMRLKKEQITFKHIPYDIKAR